MFSINKNRYDCPPISAYLSKRLPFGLSGAAAGSRPSVGPTAGGAGIPTCPFSMTHLAGKKACHHKDLANRRIGLRHAWGVGHVVYRPQTPRSLRHSQQLQAHLDQGAGHADLRAASADRKTDRQIRYHPIAACGGSDSRARTPAHVQRDSPAKRAVAPQHRLRDRQRMGIEERPAAVRGNSRKRPRC